MFGRKGKPDSLDPYRDAVSTFGPSFDALLWNSPEFQQIRFEALARAVDPAARHLADIGCGRADFLRWLLAHDIECDYLGVEGLPELARASRDAGATTIEGDFVANHALFRRLVEAHGVTTFYFSGSLNTLPMRDAIPVLDRAFDALPDDGALAFNFLSDRYDRPGPTDPAH
ncbi:MAG: hypothetical protein KDA28_00400, partial [Phycisphaerales bacterium]|nr:hypothetical protein [Phycisphaerales bacterium]